MWFPIAIIPYHDDRWRLRLAVDPKLRVRFDCKTLKDTALCEYEMDMIVACSSWYAACSVVVLEEMTEGDVATRTATEATDEQFERLLREMA